MNTTNGKELVATGKKIGKGKKVPSLWHQWFEIINKITYMGFSRHAWKQEHDGDCPFISSKSTRETYLDSGKRFTKWLKQQQDKPKYITDVHHGHVKRFFEEQIRNWEETGSPSPYTMHTDRSALAKVLGFKSSKYKLPSVGGASKIKQGRKETYLSSLDEKKVEGLPLFLSATGLRRSEVIRLHRDDIDLQAGTVFVRRGKGGKARTVNIRPDLLEYVRYIPFEAEYPFAMVKKLKNLNVHSYRREFARSLFRQRMGMDYKTARQAIRDLYNEFVLYDEELAKKYRDYGMERLYGVCGEVSIQLGHGPNRIPMMQKHYLS